MTSLFLAAWMVTARGLTIQAKNFCIKNKTNLNEIFSFYFYIVYGKTSEIY